jgi:hypothetical protein
MHGQFVAEHGPHKRDQLGRRIGIANPELRLAVAGLDKCVAHDLAGRAFAGTTS